MSDKFQPGDVVIFKAKPNPGTMVVNAKLQGDLEAYECIFWSKKGQKMVFIELAHYTIQSYVEPPKP